MLWRKRAVLDEDFLPKDVGRRMYTARVLMELRYGDHESYGDSHSFLLSLERLLLPDHLDSVLNSNIRIS